MMAIKPVLAEQQEPFLALIILDTVILSMTWVVPMIGGRLKTIIYGKGLVVLIILVPVVGDYQLLQSGTLSERVGVNKTTTALTPVP